MPRSEKDYQTKLMDNILAIAATMKLNNMEIIFGKVPGFMWEELKRHWQELKDSSRNPELVQSKWFSSDDYDCVVMVLSGFYRNNPILMKPLIEGLERITILNGLDLRISAEDRSAEDRTYFRSYLNVSVRPLSEIGEPLSLPWNLLNSVSIKFGNLTKMGETSYNSDRYVQVKEFFEECHPL